MESRIKSLAYLFTEIGIAAPKSLNSQDWWTWCWLVLSHPSDMNSTEPQYHKYCISRIMCIVAQDDLSAFRKIQWLQSLNLSYLSYLICHLWCSGGWLALACWLRQSVCPSCPLKAMQGWMGCRTSRYKGILEIAEIKAINWLFLELLCTSSQARYYIFADWQGFWDIGDGFLKYMLCP